MKPTLITCSLFLALTQYVLSLPLTIPNPFGDDIKVSGNPFEFKGLRLFGGS